MHLFNSCLPIVAKGHHVEKWIVVNFGSANGLMSDGNKPSPEPMFTYHQESSLVVTWELFQGRVQNISPKMKFENGTSKIWEMPFRGLVVFVAKCAKHHKILI